MISISAFFRPFCFLFTYLNGLTVANLMPNQYICAHTAKIHNSTFYMIQNKFRSIYIWFSRKFWYFGHAKGLRSLTFGLCSYYVSRIQYRDVFLQQYILNEMALLSFRASFLLFLFLRVCTAIQYQCQFFKSRQTCRFNTTQPLSRRFFFRSSFAFKSYALTNRN